MSSHLSGIGMHAPNWEAMKVLLELAQKQAVTHPCKKGCYQVWTSTSGAQLWLHMDARGQVMGFQPFFAGETEMQVCITDRLPQKTNGFEGALYAWANPAEGDEMPGVYPFVFDCVNLAELPQTLLPAQGVLHMVAFALEIEVFVNEQAYFLNKGDQAMAPQSFIPSGTFSLEGPELSLGEMRPHAILTGEILKSRRLVNELTEAVFYGLKVQTLGGMLEIVAAEDMFPHLPEVGGIVSGAFYLCGRLEHNLQSTFHQPLGWRGWLAKKNYLL